MASAQCFAVIFMLACLNLRSIVNADCYIGSIRSNAAGNIPISSVHALKVQDCGPSPKPTTTAPTPITEVITTEIVTEVNTTTEILTTEVTTALATNASTEAPTTTINATATTTVPTTKAPTTPKPQPTTGKQDNLSEGDPTPTPTPGPTPTPKVTPTPEPKTRCAWFKYFEGGSKLTPTTVWVANFSCVQDCVSGKQTINGTNGTLTCCESANCNSLDYFMATEKVQYQTVGQCAIGNTDKDDINLKFNQSCTADTSYFCVNKTYATNGNMTYGCSDSLFDQFCINQGFINAFGGCAKDDADNTTKCCCSLDNCNYATAPPKPSPEPTPIPSHHGLTKGTITGLVFMGFFIGFMAGCCLTCYCFKKKRGGGESVDFNYQRINANTPGEDAEY